jgi:hypothetical protein
VLAASPVSQCCTFYAQSLQLGASPARAQGLTQPVARRSPVLADEMRDE